MNKHGRLYREKAKLVNGKEAYALDQAIDLLLKTSPVKFDASIEVSFNLNIDPRHADQQIKGAVVLPAGTGKTQKILALSNTKQQEAKEAGADYIGGKDLIKKIKTENWFDFDVIVATPDIMAELAQLGRLLGPKGYMPNPKLGTVTMEIGRAIRDIKNGKAVFKSDKFGNIHAVLGKVSFTPAAIKENYLELFEVIKKAKPAAVKGRYIKNISLCTSMGPGIKILQES